MIPFVLVVLFFACGFSSMSLEDWPAKMSHRAVNVSVVCRVGELAHSEVELELEHNDRPVWIGLRAEESVWWAVELSNVSASPFASARLYQVGSSPLRLALTWRLVREPLLKRHNTSVELALPLVAALVAFSEEAALISPLRVVRPAPGDALVAVQLLIPDVAWLRILGALMAGCAVCGVMFLVSLRKLDALDGVLARRLEHEERLSNASPDAVVGGVRIFSTKGKVIKRFGAKKNTIL
jgi:hypothetical protein